MPNLQDQTLIEQLAEELTVIFEKYHETPGEDEFDSSWLAFKFQVKAKLEAAFRELIDEHSNIIKSNDALSFEVIDAYRTVLRKNMAKVAGITLTEEKE